MIGNAIWVPFDGHAQQGLSVWIVTNAQLPTGLTILSFVLKIELHDFKKILF